MTASAIRGRLYKLSRESQTKLLQSFKKCLTFQSTRDILNKLFRKKRHWTKLIKWYKRINHNKSISLKRNTVSVWAKQTQSFYWEFDPGSGRTLAARLTHASRAMNIHWSLRGDLNRISGERVSNAWGTCLSQRDSLGKPGLIPYDTTSWHHLVVKVLAVRDGLASD